MHVVVSSLVAEAIQVKEVGVKGFDVASKSMRPAEPEYAVPGDVEAA